MGGSWPEVFHFNANANTHAWTAFELSQFREASIFFYFHGMNASDMGLLNTDMPTPPTPHFTPLIKSNSGVEFSTPVLEVISILGVGKVDELLEVEGSSPLVLNGIKLLALSPNLPLPNRHWYDHKNERVVVVQPGGKMFKGIAHFTAASSVRTLPGESDSGPEWRINITLNGLQPSDVPNGSHLWIARKLKEAIFSDRSPMWSQITFLMQLLCLITMVKLLLPKDQVSYAAIPVGFVPVAWGIYLAASAKTRRERVVAAIGCVLAVAWIYFSWITNLRFLFAA